MSLFKMPKMRCIRSLCTVMCALSAATNDLQLLFFFSIIALDHCTLKLAYWWLKKRLTTMNNICGCYLSYVVHLFFVCILKYVSQPYKYYLLNNSHTHTEKKQKLSCIVTEIFLTILNIAILINMIASIWIINGAVRL